MITTCRSFVVVVYTILLRLIIKPYTEEEFPLFPDIDSLYPSGKSPDRFPIPAFLPTNDLHQALTNGNLLVVTR